jgi:hypothetical protein
LAIRSLSVIVFALHHFIEADVQIAFAVALYNVFFAEHITVQKTITHQPPHVDNGVAPMLREQKRVPLVPRHLRHGLYQNVIG